MTKHLLPGLLSVTFRQFNCEQIIDLASQAKLAGVEWGGDVHVPPDDQPRAAEVARRCADAGLAVSAYGSYYRSAASAPDEFKSVLDTAATLQTKTIRVWAGVKGSKDSTAAERVAVVVDLRRICALAAPLGVTVATEFHGGTLTDEIESCCKLLEAVDAPNLKTFWQPHVGMPQQPAAATLQRVIDRLSNLHVFHWWPTGKDRQPLAAGQERWKQYLSIADAQCKADGVTRHASLEFVKDDSIEQFRDDAASLIGWLNQL